MQLIQYVHDKKLKHVFVKRRFCINETMFRQPNNTMLISFSPVEGNISTRKFIVNGTSRFMNEFDGDVALINVQNDSALYAHLLWDVAHQLKVGQYLYIKEAIATESMLERAYYHEAFQRIETSESGFDIYEKVQRLPVEKEQGLEQWSFCIPVGPDEPTFLNACAERILELDVPQKEILLCGMPHPDFSISIRYALWVPIYRHPQYILRARKMSWRRKHAMKIYASFMTVSYCPAISGLRW